MKLVLVNGLLIAALVAQAAYIAGEDGSVSAVSGGSEAAQSAPENPVDAFGHERAAVEPEAVAAIGERPLFTETREPPAPRPEPDQPQAGETNGADGKEEKQPPEPLEAVLRAIVKNGEGGWILLQAEGGEIHRLEPGDTRAGWTLESLTPDRASFTNNGHRQTLKLRNFEQ